LGGILLGLGKVWMVTVATAFHGALSVFYHFSLKELTISTIIHKILVITHRFSLGGTRYLVQTKLSMIV
jgi:hypothetical protein